MSHKPRKLTRSDPRIKRAIEIVRKADTLDNKLRKLSLASVRDKQPLAIRRVFGNFRIQRFRARHNKKVLKARKRLIVAGIEVR